MMENFGSCFRDLDTSKKVLCVVGGCAVAYVSVAVLRKLFHSSEEKKVVYPRDTVILHQIGRGPHAPSLTPFAVKMETYLRMAKIPYQNTHGYNPSSKGKVPWIEYNGEPVADTTLGVDFLNKKLGVDLNKHLRPADKAVAQAMHVMVEEHLYWCLCLHRWVYDNDKSFLIKAMHLNRFVMWRVKSYMQDMAYKQGLGRHTVEEVNQFMEKDLKAMENWIGPKKFLMGNEPCEADCAVFGMLSQLYWHAEGTGLETLMKDKYPNLAAYCERMKTTFWPDWDQCITHGQTREATK